MQRVSVLLQRSGSNRRVPFDGVRRIKISHEPRGPFFVIAEGTGVGGEGFVRHQVASGPEALALVEELTAAAIEENYFVPALDAKTATNRNLDPEKVFLRKGHRAMRLDMELYPFAATGSFDRIYWTAQVVKARANRGFFVRVSSGPSWRLSTYRETCPMDVASAALLASIRVCEQLLQGYALLSDQPWLRIKKLEAPTEIYEEALARRESAIPPRQ